MKLINLKEVSNFEIRDYLKKRYDLTNQQYIKMVDDDFPRHSHYYFFKEEKQMNGGFIWRLSLPLIIPYFIFLVIYIFFKWIFTGNRYFEKNSFILKFHKYWMSKLGIDWL